MGKKLDEHDLTIFHQILQSPLSSKRGIARNISGSKQLVSDRIRKMKDIRFLRPDSLIKLPVLGQREQTEVESLIQPQSVGLKRIHLLLQTSKHNRELVSRSLQRHPYIHHISCYFAGNMSIYAQIDIPNGAYDQLKVYVKELTDIVSVADYQLINPDLELDNRYQYSDKLENDVKYLESSQNLSRFNRPVGLIEYHWAEFTKRSEFRPDIISKSHINEEYDPHNFDRLDLALLREININAKPSFTELSKFYSKSVSTIARRIEQLRRKCIGENRVFFNKNYFDIHDHKVIYFELDEITIPELTSFINSLNYPVFYSLSVDSKLVQLRLETTPRLVSHVVDFLFQYQKNVTCLNHLPYSNYTFYFNPLNYLDHEWNMSSEDLVEKPLEVIDERLDKVPNHNVN